MNVMPRRLFAVALSLILLLGAVLAPNSAAVARHHYTKWARVHVTASATATATATASATASATAGTPASTVKVTARASSHQSATATRSAWARAKGTAMKASTARARAWAKARARALRQAARAAHALAQVRALAAARRDAQVKATATAKAAALSQARTLSATRTKPAPGPGSAPCGGSLPKSGGGTWTCTFDDEFDGSTLDTTKWTVGVTSQTGHSDAHQTCYVNSPNNISVAHGVLNLTVRKQAAPFTCINPYTGNFVTSYTSGEVATIYHFSQTYGRFEVRAQFPAATVKGLNETLWMWPDKQTYGSFPASGEIDFAQGYSSVPGWSIPTLHYNPATTANFTTDTNVQVQWPAPYNEPGSNCEINQSSYNTYTVIWKPGTITILVNGHTCLIDNYSAAGLAGAAPFDQPFFMVLTQALDTGSGPLSSSLKFPETTKVDYVRAWK